MEKPKQSVSENPGRPVTHIVSSVDFVGRDKIVWGDEVHGDKIAGNKTDVRIDRVEPGAQVIITDLGIRQAAPLAIPSPPKPTKPPSVEGFLGRETELTRYLNHLQTNGSVVIAGMPGVGKTMLMAKLAKQIGKPKNIFWHPCHQGESLLTLIRKLAGFLFWHGKGQVWQMLQAAQLSGGQPPAQSDLLDYLCEQLQDRAYVLCIDDLHVLYNKNDNPLLEQLLEGIGAVSERKQLKVLIAWNETPPFKQRLVTEPLPGLKRSDAHDLLVKHGLVLSEALTTELYTRTEGNAELLILAVQALHERSDQAQLIGQLATAYNIEHYLLTQVDANLTEEERAVMNGVAILLGYPATSEEIEGTKAAKNVRRLLIHLTNRYLLTTSLDKAAKRYVQHGIVQEFYYKLLNNEERMMMHQHIAHYYESTEHDLLKAAMHYARAGEHIKAATLATVDVWSTLGRGNAQILRRLFGEIQVDALNTELQIRIQIAQGEIFHFFGEPVAAQARYDAALTRLEKQPHSSATRLQRAYIYQMLGELFWAESLQTGLEWFLCGLDALVDLDMPEATQRRAALQIHGGVIYALLSRFDEAEASIQQGLKLVNNPVSPLVVDSMMNLGLIYSSRGQMEQARQYTQQALTLCEQLHDPYRHFKLLAATALGKDAAGDLTGALTDHRAALASVDTVGYTIGRVYERINLGYLLVRLEYFNEAAEYLHTAFTLAQASQLYEPMVMIHINLAHVAFHRKDFPAALAALELATTQAKHIGVIDSEPEIAYLRAQVWLAQGDIGAARQDAEFAVQQAIALDKAVEQGIALRVLGQVSAAENNASEAAATFERSLALLKGKDHFEFTRTQQYKDQLLSAHPTI